MIRFSKEKVLLLHKMIAQETGGSIGVRDEGLLESELEGAFATFDGQELYPGKEEKGARIGFTLISKINTMTEAEPVLIILSTRVPSLLIHSFYVARLRNQYSSRLF